ncbi:MAG: hypothetical protein JWN76_1479 [Chitinophagaceae bacterium]|nr:hypothetical protein [Chitinophagaceae bacterium]
MKKSLRFSLTLIAIAYCLSAEAQSDQTINVVTTAVPFLRISPDARAGGMGDAGIATMPDANSPFWNLAKLPFAKSNFQIGATYTPWLKDIAKDVYLASLSGYYKVDDQSAISASMRYFSLGQIQLTDFSGNDIGTSRPKEFAIDFGYSRKLTEKLGVGVGLRYINSNLAAGVASPGVNYKAGTAVAGDISLFQNGTDSKGEGFNWGISISNLGSKIGYTSDAKTKDYIPANLGIGLAYTKVFDEFNRITFAADVNKLLVPAPPTYTGDDKIDSTNLSNYRSNSVFGSWFKSFSDGGGQFKSLQFSLGAEYLYNEQFAVRVGYFYEDKTKGNRKFFTVGLGLKYNTIGINFSYLVPSGNGITRNPLSNTLRFGLVFDLDNSNE